MPQEDPLKLWQHIHGASAHFPIVGMMLALCFDFGSLLFRRPQWKVVGFWCLFAAAVVSIPAVLSGLTGQNGWLGVDKWVSISMDKHRNIALIAAGSAILLSLWRIIRKDDQKGAEWFVYLALMLAATAAIGYTGFLGAYVARGY